MRSRILFFIGFALLACMNAEAREIGNGQGTSYPYAIDLDTRPETADDYAREGLINDISSAIVTMQGTMGTNPQGNYATMKARFAAIELSTSASLTVDAQCRLSTGTIKTLALQLGVDTATIVNALSSSTNSIVLALRVSTSTLSANHISSMTTIDGLLFELYKSTGNIAFQLRISTTALFNAHISTCTNIDTALRELYISTGAAGLRGANQTWTQPNTAISSWTFLAAISGISMNLADGCTLQRLSSGDAGHTAGEVYTKFASTDSWGRSAASASSGGGSGSTTYYMTLGGQQQDLYASASVPYDTDIIPDSATLTGLMTFACYGSSNSIWFGIRTSTGSSYTPTWTNQYTIELPTNTVSSGWQTISYDINNSATYLGLFVNSWYSAGMLPPVGAGVKVRYWRKQ